MCVGYVNNSLHKARKFAGIFVRGHYLFREAESCGLRGTDNVQGQISEHIFGPNGGYFVYYPLYNNQTNASALIGQSAVGYCAGKPMEKSRVF